MSKSEHQILLQKLQSQDGKKLIQMLQNESNATIANAVAAAKSGNYELAKQLLDPILKNPSISELAKKVNNHIG